MTPLPMIPLRAILFDLDGTVVQAHGSLWQLFERTNRKFALGIDTQEQFFDLFQDNFFVALPHACGDEALARAALEHFLELMRTEYQPPLVPGMSNVIQALALHCVLGIISSNALLAIRRIIEKAKLVDCIAHVFAGDVVPDKRVAIRQFLEDPSYATLRRCSATYEEHVPVPLRLDEVALVTDTIGDVRHARECGIRVIGVAWGMHDRQALTEAGAEWVANWPQEIVAWVRGRAQSQLTDLLDSTPEQT